MKRRTRFSLAFFALALCCAVPALAADELPARHQYTLDFTLDMETKSYSGTETVLVVNHSEDPWDGLLLRDYATVARLVQRRSYRDGSGQEVFLEPDAESSRIAELRRLDTGEALEWRREKDDPSMVWVALEDPLMPGQAMEISFGYGADLFWGRGNLCWQQRGRTTYVNLGNFYPILSVYEDGAWRGERSGEQGEYFYSPISDYRVTLTAPKNYIVAASAAGAEPVAVGDALRWSYEGAGLRDFALSLSDGFGMLTERSGETEVRSYFLKGEEVVGQRQLAAAVDSLELFGELFGYPYPYETYSVVKGVMDSGGMEYPGMVIVDGTVELGRAEEVVERDLADFCSVVVHETAHQWFYAIVGSDSGLQPWLDEGMARFCEWIYAQRFTPERYPLVIKQMKDFTDGYPPHTLNRTVAEMGQSYGVCAYFYGGRFLYELREAVGEELFYSCMRRYVNENAMGEAHTADFVDVFLRGCGWDGAARAVMEEYLFPAYLDMAGDPAQSAAALTSAYGVFHGTAPGRFSPGRTVDRATAVTLLYRMAGSPAVLGYSDYADVERGSWYEKAVLWATMEGVSQGVGRGKFDPERAITQGEFLTLLGRAWPGLTLEGPASDGDPITRANAAVILEQVLMQKEIIGQE